MVICYLILGDQSRHSPVHSCFGVPPPSLSTLDCQLLTSSSSTFQCAGRLPRLSRLPAPTWSGPRPCRGASRDPGRTTPQSASLRNLSVRRLPRPGRGVSALDFPWFGLTLDFQLSTFNRVSFLSPSSPHLCALCVLCGENSSSFRSSLIPRHSPLTTNSFIIRTSETPLPQLLYNPHLQAPLGSAGNKGLITPLESALTKNSPVTSLESALTKSGGGGAA